ncbi:two-component sensor histidine kinase [Vagococcus penaei]|uniref:Sensor histidine kinase n=1 Tax=Vagococcus penaei TaxID=633807 RepID=A0A1Q2D3U1_9ENTE|nr:sensor histidine kinase [Vagococcus penaei]AQP53064.1 two-component sensor histidine kinase [Vagococcus penaei]RSU06072.1 two-component sensor histidine kinase [Vagococcus penaei]
MMEKLNRPLVFFYTFLFTFIVLILTLYMYFFAKKQNYWMGELLTVQMFKIPLLIYVILISIVVGFVVLAFLYFIDYKIYGKVEMQLRLMALGQYEHRKTMESLENHPTQIDLDIQSIRMKLVDMTKDLQELSQRPQLVDGQTKENIIKEERHRIARELHDSVSQQLFAATMMLSTLNEIVAESEIPEIIEKQLKVITGIIDSSQSEMRALLLHLRPINLENKSLKSGVELLLKELQTKINIEVVWDIENVSTKSAIEDHLFRIVQELLSNTLRHAKATTLEVYLKSIDQNLLLKVVDDGVGFDMEQDKVGSYGLGNIQERVTGIGGTLKIVSFKNQGTSIEIKIPLI